MYAVGEEDTARVLRRDVLLLFALGVATIGVFVFTKAMAARELAMETHVAETWYQDGLRKFKAGSIDGAIESLRKATGIDRDNRGYMLALADALAAGNHDIEAEQALMHLRDADPTNAEINLHLARLAAKTGDVQKAVIFYHSSLDGMWKGPTAVQQRRQIRTELIYFLLAHHDETRALSELLVLDADLPSTATAHIQIAKLFWQAGDAQRALNDYVEAIKLDPHNAEALAGAGTADFRLGDYHKAHHYLEEAAAEGDESTDTAQLLSLVRMVTAEDPLAPGLPADERQKRLLADLDQATRRLDQCQSRGTSPDLDALNGEAGEMRTNLASKVFFADPGLMTSGLGLIYRIENAVDARCGAAEGQDEALLLIGRRHGDTQ